MHVHAFTLPHLPLVTNTKLVNNKLSQAVPCTQGRIRCGWGLEEAGRKLSVQPGNVWLGPNAQIRAEVLGPECKEGGRPQGKKRLHLREHTSKKETILTCPKLHYPEWRCLCD